MRSQLELVLSLVYQRERRCMEILEKIKKGTHSKARISPEKAADALFPNEAHEDQLLCFFLLVYLGNELALEVIEDIGKRDKDAISVDEAILILNDDLKNVHNDARLKQKTEKNGIT